MSVDHAIHNRSSNCGAVSWNPGHQGQIQLCLPWFGETGRRRGVGYREETGIMVLPLRGGDILRNGPVAGEKCEEERLWNLTAYV